MFRYVIFLSDPTSAGQAKTVDILSKRLTAASHQWLTSFKKGRVTILCADVRPGSLAVLPLTAYQGAILGVAFKRSDPLDRTAAKLAVAADIDIGKTIESGGRNLIKDFWGNYLAILHPSPKRVLIVKDPTGPLPCFRTTYQDVIILFSDIADFLSVGASTFTVNWSFVRRCSAGGGMVSASNSLNEANQVFGGESLDVTWSSSSQPRILCTYQWNPLSFVKTEHSVDSADHACNLMRATVHQCVSTWARCFDDIIVRLSGGLDSSIILGCIRHTQSDRCIICYTQYCPGGRSDERPWARIAARDARCMDHVEWPYDPRSVQLANILSTRKSVTPVPLLWFITAGIVERAIAADRGATAIFSGEGGDAVFGSEAIGYVVDDFVTRNGLRLGILSRAAQVALHQDVTVWNVLKGVLRRYLFGSRIKDWRRTLLESSKLVSREIREDLFRAQYYAHPWFASTSDVPWSTILQLGILPFRSEFYDLASAPGSPDPQWISPLYSQPVVESCLSIPLHIRFENGSERGLARRAFVDEVPLEIRRRRWKDRVPGYDDVVVDRNRAFFRELLLDGHLVKQGILNRTVLEHVLSGSHANHDVSAGELFNHLDMEVWLRMWQN